MASSAGGKAIASKMRFPLESMTRLEELEIDALMDMLTCTMLCIRLPYTDEAMEELRSQLTEKLSIDRVYVIGNLKIAAPRQIDIVLDAIHSLSIQVEKIEIESSLNSLEQNDWIDKALSFDHLESFRLTLSEANESRKDIIKSILDRSLSVRRLFITLKDEGSKQCYYDDHLLTDAYLLKLAKTTKEEVILDFGATSKRLTPNGMIAAIEELTKRTHDVKLSLQIYNSKKARDIKASILSEWNINETINNEFKPTNKARKEPVMHDQYTIFNDGKSLCIFNGRVLLTLPIMEILDGEQWNWRRPFTFSIERIMDKNANSLLNQDTYYADRK